ncbi:MAG: polynucleotide adenylyltransferase PcnB [Chlamydiales bacterium]|nr:polynucleotide adenylyltransferase PcnB [Chlamydiales bacterium]
MKQKIYPIEEHGLPIDQIDRDALYVMEKLQSAGYIAYLVGGSVRDLLLRKTPKDFDISTSAEPEEIKKLFRNCILIGRRFRLAHVRFGKKVVEVATFRSGDLESTDLVIRDNKWGSEEEDVMRRDFTINGLFYDPSTQTIIDYVGGYPDALRKYLRTIGQPFVRFKQDPVRMIRLLKFQARFGLEIDPDARIALLECRHEILKSSSARVLEELLRMLELGSACSFFRLMTEHGLLQLMMPALAEFLEKDEGEEIYDFLQEVDSTFHEPPLPILERPVLVSCLLFPIFQRRLLTRYEDRGRHPHLGEILFEANDLIDEVFSTFFHISRRLKVGISSVLTAQFRLTPFEKKRGKHLRVPNDPDFPLALKFLEVRAALEPGLQKVVEDWNLALTSPQLPPKKRRRRKKSKSGTPEGKGHSGSEPNA